MKKVTLEELLHLYIQEALNFDVVTVESVLDRSFLNPDTGVTTGKGWRVEARVNEMGKKSDNYYSVEHSKVFIIKEKEFKQFKRDKNLEELLD